MTTLDDFFTKPTDDLHPRLRKWKARLGEAGTSATLEVFRPEIEFGQCQPEMSLQFTRDGISLPLETVLWDDDLNAGLIQLRVRAASPEQEAKRFTLALRAVLRKAEIEFGNGYFNSVLVDLLKDSDLIKRAEIAEVLKHIHVLGAKHESKGFNTCREMIASAISGRARELTETLSYSRKEAERIFIAAVARYLDERFSVSNRRRMGLL